MDQEWNKHLERALHLLREYNPMSLLWQQQMAAWGDEDRRLDAICHIDSAQGDTMTRVRFREVEQKAKELANQIRSPVYWYRDGEAPHEVWPSPVPKL